jgi:L,D-peptidoglycan transpeptidase YkuD (ErfK/YbiS/YcfS/YnhG family)
MLVAAAALILAGCAALAPRPTLDASPLPALTRQLVVVVSADWDAASGTLRRFDRAPGGGWKEAGLAEPVNLGRTGLAWGRGLHPDIPGAQKREGDGRAPAGLFRLPGAFGYEPRTAGLAFTVATASLECVDDVASPSYNRLVDTAGRPADWTSSERMRRDDALYSLGVLVDHNVAPVVAGAGSCIFMHVWRGPARPTAGCTSMDPEAVERLVGWLESSASPVLVQLPVDEYRRLARAWGLPGLER